MAIELTPLGQNPVRNTVEEIYAFARLNTDLIQPSEVRTSLYFSADQVAFLCPDEETEADRSNRSEALRKRAEAYLCVAELYEIIATTVALTTPPKQILTTLNLSIGSDFPTPDIVQRAFEKTADRYRQQGERILKIIRPVLQQIEAGDARDE